MPPRSPTRFPTRAFFSDPFRYPTSFTRPSRSPSASSSASFVSTTSSYAGPHAGPHAGERQRHGPSSTLDEILALSYSTQSRNASLTSFSSSRRPSCFSILEAEEERAEFGEQCVGVLEPRNSVGWWGMKEVLQEDKKER